MTTKFKDFSSMRRCTGLGSREPDKLSSYWRRLQSYHFRVTEICVVMDLQSSQRLKL